MNTKHPYAAIQHRVIDSDAYADLTHSAQALLTLIARQLTKSNNGHLHAAFSYIKKFGFGSEHTLARAIKQLISHGFIYRTRMGGYQQGPSKYAVTWLPITQKEGLFLQGFKACAWREWVPQKKSPPAKKQPVSCKNGSPSTDTAAVYAAEHPAKNADNELMPVGIKEHPLSESELIVFPWEGLEK